MNRKQILEQSPDLCVVFSWKTNKHKPKQSGGRKKCMPAEALIQSPLVQVNVLPAHCVSIREQEVKTHLNLPALSCKWKKKVGTLVQQGQTRTQDTHISEVALLKAAELVWTSQTCCLELVEEPWPLPGGITQAFVCLVFVFSIFSWFDCLDLALPRQIPVPGRINF
jgi:hypothetical protein